MAQRKIYTAKNNMTFNDKNVGGQELALVGPCTFSGQTKSQDGKRIPKNDLTHVKLKFTDKKWLKDNGLIPFLEYVCKKDHLSVFFCEKTS